MVSSISTIMYNLELLNKKSSNVTYQMSSEKALQYGSDDSQQYNKILTINNNVKSYSSILDRIQSSSAFNTVSDSSISNMKTPMESVQGLISTALTSTTNSENKVSIATEVESIKDTIYSLSNTKIDGQYLFSGANSSVESFKKDATTGKITYNSSNNNKTINVEDNVYNTQGVNGIELLYYINQTVKTGENLTFEENEIILDEEGNKYKLLDTNGDDEYDGLYLDGDNTNTPLSITKNTDGTYEISNSTTSSLTSKHSIFDYLDEIINALKQQDSNGNSISEDEATIILSSALEKFETAYDAMNTTHAKLGTRTASIENYESIVQTKLTNFNLLQETYSSADLTTLAIESQSLQNTYTALYSTINKINNLSLVNYLS